MNFLFQGTRLRYFTVFRDTKTPNTAHSTLHTYVVEVVCGILQLK